MQVTNNTNKENIKTGEVLTNFNVSWNSFIETFTKLNTVIFFEEREPVLDTKKEIQQLEIVVYYLNISLYIRRVKIFINILYKTKVGFLLLYFLTICY